MEHKNGRTFWDLISENKSIQIVVAIIFIVIIIAIIFFAAKGYTISSSAIIPPHQDIKNNTAIPESLSNIRVSRGITSMFKLLWLIIFLNILSVLTTILLYFFSSSKNKANYIGETSKKVQVFEHIYQSFISFTLYDREQSQELLTEIQLLSKFTIDNGLYIDKQLMKLTNDFTDYFKEVIVDYREKDFAKEKEFQNKFRRIFN